MKSDDEVDPGRMGLLVLAAVAGTISLPAVVLGMALTPLAKRHRGVMLAVAAAV